MTQGQFRFFLNAQVLCLWGIFTGR